MLKYRINKKEVINNNNIIIVENVEDYRNIEGEKKSKISSVNDTFICTFTCKSIDSLNANEDAKNKIYTVHNFSAIDDEGTEYPCNYTYEYEVEGSVVNTKKNTFSLELSKLFLLPTVSIGRVAIYPNDGDIKQPSDYMYIYFQNCHLFNRYSNNGDEMTIKLYFNCYTNNSIEFFCLEMEYVTPFVVRCKYDEDNKNLKKLFQDKQNNVNIHDVEVYRETPLFGIYDNYIIYNNSPVCSINLPLSIKFRTDLQKEQLMADYLTDRKAKSINKINDMEKDVYHPVQWDNEKNEKKNDIYQLIFNLHFREHRYDDWNAAPDSYWNGVINDPTAKENDDKLRLMNNSNEEELGFFSYGNDNWKRSDQSDLLSYLNFTNEDVRYQKSKLKKSFLRLLFFDSMNPADQNLLAYSTVFIDSGALFSKYVRHFEGEGFSALNYNGEIVLSTSTDLNGIRINREPMIGKETYEEFKDDLEDVRLSSQFVIKDKYNSTTSSEGFYLYLWRDNDNGIIPSDLYMKVEFNHAGYGRTIPFMMPYEDKDDDNKGKIKTFKEIVEDWRPIKNENENKDKNKDKYVGYGIKRYLKYSYIHLKYQYDETDKRHVYYVDTDLYKGTDKSIYGIDNTMKFDLYEAKINFDSEITDNEVGTSSEYVFSVNEDSVTFEQNGGKVIINVTSYLDKNGQRKNLKFVVNENGLNWCKWEQNGNTITIIAEENNYNRKQGTLILIQEKSNKQIRIDISQEEKTISTNFVAEPKRFDVEDKGDTCEVEVTSEYYNGEEIDYTITKSENSDWITNINQTPDGFVFDVKANEEAIERHAKISLMQLLDSSENSTPIEIVISQEAKKEYTFMFKNGNDTLNVENTGGEYQIKVISKVTSKDFNKTRILFTALANTNYIVESIDISSLVDLNDYANGVFILKLTCNRNSSSEELQDSITLIQNESGKELTLKVIQEAKGYDFYFEDEPSIIQKNETVLYTVTNKCYRIVSTDNENNGTDFSISPSDNNIINNISAVQVKDGIYELSFDITQNDGDNEREISLELTQNSSGKMLSINIIQLNKESITLPNFDNLILRYNWSEDDGKDLHTMTVINGTGLTIDNKKVDGYYVGHGSTNNDSDFVLQHSGDNGDESCLIRMEDICTEENLLAMKENGKILFNIDLYGLWYSSKNSGNVTIEMIGYKGGVISLGMKGEESEWIVDGGENVFTKAVIANVNAFVNCTPNSVGIPDQYCNNYRILYTKIGSLKYNITTRTAYLTLTGKESGYDSLIELYVSPNLIEDIPSDGALDTVTLYSSTNGNGLKCSIENNADWLTLNIDGNKIQYEVSPNEEPTNRETVVKVRQLFTNFSTDLTIKQLGKIE